MMNKMPSSKITSGEICKRVAELPIELQKKIDSYSKRFMWENCIKGFHNSPEWRESNVVYNRIRIYEWDSSTNGDLIALPNNKAFRMIAETAYNIQYHIYLDRYPLNEKSPQDPLINIIRDKLWTKTNWEKEIWNSVFGNLYALCTYTHKEYRHNDHNKIIRNFIHSVWLSISSCEMPILFTRITNNISKQQHINPQHPALINHLNGAMPPAT